MSPENFAANFTSDFLVYILWSERGQLLCLVLGSNGVLNGYTVLSGYIYFNISYWFKLYHISKKHQQENIYKAEEKDGRLLH